LGIPFVRGCVLQIRVTLANFLVNADCSLAKECFLMPDIDPIDDDDSGFDDLELLSGMTSCDRILPF
jgi:hypothetical protein